jgi:hypothetical protein
MLDVGDDPSGVVPPVESRSVARDRSTLDDRDSGLRVVVETPVPVDDLHNPSRMTARTAYTRTEVTPTTITI